jgi:hypothetical protein
VFQVTTGGGSALVIYNISDWQARGDQAKALIEGSEFAE